MLTFLADENFDGNIVRGLLRRQPALDLVRVQDTSLSGADDPTVLEWAAQSGRILLTHDIAIITKYAYDRVFAGLPMPGVVEVRPNQAIGEVIDNLGSTTLSGEK